MSTALVAVAGFAAFVVDPSLGTYTLGDAHAPLDSLILLALGFVLTFFHELGHALAIVHFGRRVKSAGFMLYFGSPAFFVEASDSLMLERRAADLESFAGPFAEIDPRRAAPVFLLARSPTRRFAPSCTGSRSSTTS